MVALRRLLPQVRFEVDGKPELDNVKAEIALDDFMAAFKVVAPTATREFLAERPRQTLKDVGGLAETKRTLTSIMQLFRGGGALIGHTRFNPPKGILLTGQSGTGKTLLARALAGEMGLTLITVDQTELALKVGRGVREGLARSVQAGQAGLAMYPVLRRDRIDGSGAVGAGGREAFFHESSASSSASSTTCTVRWAWSSWGPPTGRTDGARAARGRGGSTTSSSSRCRAREERREILGIQTEGLPLDERRQPLRAGGVHRRVDGGGSGVDLQEGGDPGPRRASHSSVWGFPRDGATARRGPGPGQNHEIVPHAARDGKEVSSDSRWSAGSIAVREDNLGSEGGISWGVR